MKVMTHCPYCDATISHAKPVAAKWGPQPGDYLRCTDCLAWCVFDQSLHLRKATASELTVIKTDPRINQ